MIVLEEEQQQCGQAFLVGAIGSGVGPLGLEDLVEGLGLAVGLGPEGPVRLRRMPWAAANWEKTWER